MALLPYIRIARFDHWFKNVFMLPGVVLAVLGQPDLIGASLLWRLLVGLLSAGLIASSNYVINEVLDAPYDALHPVKKLRPVPSGQVRPPIAYGEWLLLGVLGLCLAWMLGAAFFAAALALWIMGGIYNIPPVRSKDRPYVDVLTESVNNPLRLMLGWYATGSSLVLPVSLALAYWMMGAFFMAVKRFAEYRRIGDPRIAARYRQSFGHYNEERLMVSIVYYAAAFGLFTGIFLIRYRMELILAIPLIAGLVAWYIHIGFKEDSPTQYPEKLYKQHGFVAYMVLTAVGILILLVIEFPLLRSVFEPSLGVMQRLDGGG